MLGQVMDYGTKGLVVHTLLSLGFYSGFYLALTFGVNFDRIFKWLRI
jgi:hypothetical protein